MPEVTRAGQLGVSDLANQLWSDPMDSAGLGGRDAQSVRGSVGGQRCESLL